MAKPWHTLLKTIKQPSLCILCKITGERFVFHQVQIVKLDHRAEYSFIHTHPHQEQTSAMVEYSATGELVSAALIIVQAHVCLYITYY